MRNRWLFSVQVLRVRLGSHERRTLGEAMDSSVTRRSARILVIERDPFMREALIRILGSEYEVMTAEDGLTGLEIAKKVRPDLIVTELLLPGMDGFQLLRRLKEERETRDIPVVVFSVLLAADRCRRMGADAFVEKPHHQDVLLPTVRNLLEKRHRGARDVEGTQDP